MRLAGTFFELADMKLPPPRAVDGIPLPADEGNGTKPTLNFAAVGKSWTNHVPVGSMPAFWE